MEVINERSVLRLERQVPVTINKTVTGVWVVTGHPSVLAPTNDPAFMHPVQGCGKTCKEAVVAFLHAWIRVEEEM